VTSSRWLLGVTLAAAFALRGAGVGTAPALRSVGGAGPTGSDVTSVAARPTCGGGAAAPIGGPLAALGLDAHTALEGHALVLRSELPRLVADCRRLTATPAICDDQDADGLVDAWELLVLARLGPVVRLDAEEPLLSEPGFAVALVGRVAPAAERVRAFMALLYTRDYGSCGGVTAHHGDAERVVLELEPLADGSAGDVRVRRAYTAAHEDRATQHNRSFEGGELAALVIEPDPATREPRWIVYSSRAKHATYASPAICESRSRLPCLREHCSRDEIAAPARYDLLFPVANAGEPDRPIVTDLGPCGFPGEDAWADRPFCGALGGQACGGSVRSKLLQSPF
jgi:hypothetical protein